MNKSNKTTNVIETPATPVENTPQGEILFTEAGKKATVTAYRPEGSQAVAIVLKGRGAKPKTLHISDASRIDIRSMKAKNLQEACAKAAHATGNLALFEVKEYRGKRGMIRSFHNPKTDNGYASLIRKGAKPFSFPLSRVDLSAMKSETLEDAFEKAVWATGSIAVLPYEDAAAPAQS